MNNINNPELELSLQEKETFRNLTDKILNQHSQSEILTDYEKQEFYQILHKLRLVPQNQTDRKEKSNILNLIIGSISFLAFYLLLVGIPTAIAVTLTKSSSLIILIIISATFLSIVGIGALMGKVSWGMAIVTATITLIPLIGIGVVLFSFLN